MRATGGCNTTVQLNKPPTGRGNEAIGKPGAIEHRSARLCCLWARSAGKRRSGRLAFIIAVLLRFIIAPREELRGAVPSWNFWTTFFGRSFVRRALLFSLIRHKALSRRLSRSALC